MKRIAIIIMFVGLCLEAPAQEYAFMDLSYNHIQVPGGDSTRLNRVFQRMNPDSLQQRGLNILHIGGSHVQADMFSNQVRQKLKDTFVYDGVNVFRGFVFPYTVAKTNNPSNYKVTYSGEWKAARNVQAKRDVPLGVGGIAVYTDDPGARIHVSLNPSFDRFTHWEFNTLRLLAYSLDRSDAVKPVLSYPYQLIEGIPDATGTSYLFYVPKSESEFSIEFVQQDDVPHTFVVDGFVAEKDTRGLVYHAVGVNGASVPSYLSCENWETELQFLRPDLVIFGIGINDAASANFSKESFIANYNALIERIERVNPDCAYIFITNNDSFRKTGKKRYTVNHNGLIAREAFYELAERHQGGVWDLFELMGGLSSMKQWQDAGLAKVDKIHFTKDGYLFLGDLLYEALMNYKQ
ncbi:MAG: GDSL-type esterase/lipase family protein [Candidatus Symbiothrix sp.]|jgi:lysophospholipase L1-like esterase|nr:GDSL-type esterase/lipase family protein [Candidatus Symbiothrix sp.]